ncbi:N-chimaerin-like isoform X2 [Eriocheir sinensis]|uniref:N-chimaerin-like isoform X2 n=1 Tax=Eriocheir sinensis TaxID=95602 RepID=UPI0021C5F32C|nr:N-chimaerin-like isoform X2 [Eriocheir sinensis]
MTTGSGDKSSNMWKSFLYQLQHEAPKPAAVLCTDRPPDSPPYYGLEYHGNISAHECQALLDQEGAYLVRQRDRARGFSTLSIWFDRQVKHYRLYYDGQKHYVGEKRFDTLHSLVHDGLVCLYIELHAGDHLRAMQAASYSESPYYTLTRCNRTPKRPPLGKEEEVDTQTSDSPKELNTQRPHRFSVNTFSGLIWCGFCGHFLWGFVSQGVKCQDCGFKAHKQCSYRVPNDCSPDLKNLQSIFGVDLTTSVARGSLEVPAVVTECINEIEARGLMSEGIYRVPGSQDQVVALKLAFERDGDKVSLNEKAVGDINVVAGVLKSYLRLLPISPITASCFTKLQIASKLSDPEARVSAMKEALRTLPPAHYKTVKAIILHLDRVCKHSAVNKMSATSLSTVLAPTLIQMAPLKENLQPDDLLALVTSAEEPRVVELLILYHQDVFDDTSSP